MGSRQILEHQIGLANGILSRTVAGEAGCVSLGMEPFSPCWYILALVSEDPQTNVMV